MKQKIITRQKYLGIYEAGRGNCLPYVRTSASVAFCESGR